MKRLLKTLLCLALLSALALSAAAESTNEDALVYSRYINVPGYGEWYYYAQNDPEWDQAFYESYNCKLYRRFGDSGCGPTSLAIALNKQLTPEELTSLLALKSPKQQGFGYCPCSINGFHCYAKHERTYIETPEDFLYNLPRVIGSYAAGNNKTRHLYRNDFSGTSSHLFRDVAEAYSLYYTHTSDWDEAYAALQDGYSIITSVTKGVFTPSSHYLVIAHADEEYIYLLDPWMREAYDGTNAYRFEVLEPGLVRAKTADFIHLGLYGFFMMKKVD